MASTSLSRRHMLSALAAAGGASRLGPFLPLSANAATSPKRILCVFHPMGYLEKSFWPSGTFAPGTMTNFTLGESMTALNPWKGKLILPDGMYMYGSGWLGGEDDNEHANGSNCCFTGSRKQGYSTGPSIEQVVADAQYAQAKTRYRALALGVNSGGGDSHTTVFHSKAQTPVIAQSNAQAVFDALFKDFTGPTAPVGMTPPNTPAPAPAPVDTSAADKLRKQKQSVLDMVKNDLSRLKAAAGKDDKAKIDAHLEGLSALENRLLKLPQGGMPTGSGSSPVSSGPTAPAGSVAVGCAKPTITPGGAVKNAIHSQMDLIAAAFACDLTRSASLQIGVCDGGIEADGLEVGQHDTTHASGTGAGQSVLDTHKRWDKWYVDRWAYLLGKLDSIKEGNGTMLDNTLIVFGSDTSTAQTLDQGAHNFFRFPLWMAGGGNFAFKTGQYIRLPQPNTAPQSLNLIKQWVPHQRLLTSVARAFGLNVDKFGATDPGSGPMTQLQTV